MTWIRTALHEIFGLFVDDGPFAVCILAWIVLVWGALSVAGLPPHWGGLLLFLGLAAILLESSLRRARPRR